MIPGKINSNSLTRRPRSGMTLLEMTVAMAIITVLIGMVSAISYNYLTLSSELLMRQRQEIHTQAFLDWIRRSFGNLPGNTVWQITSTESKAGGGNSPILSEMVLQEFPLNLFWNDMPVQVKAVRLRTVPQPDGLLQLDMECYDEEIFDTTSEESMALLDITPIATTTLLEGIRWCEWMTRDPNTDEWFTELKRSDSRPYQLQLNLSFGFEGVNTREVFCIPPKTDPKIMVQEMIAGGQRSGLSGSGTSGGGNNGGTSPERPGGSDGEGRTPGGGSNSEGGGRPPTGGGTPPPATGTTSAVNNSLFTSPIDFSGIERLVLLS